MTKRKDPADLKRRGPKSMPVNDESLWLVVELRRRASVHLSVSRTVDFIFRDLLEHSGTRLAIKSLRDRYNRVEQRRRIDPGFAAKLERRVAAVEGIRAERGAGLLLPGNLKSG